MSEAGHLVRRFADQLSSAGPSAWDAAWARSVCTEPEAALLERQSPQDRRHAVAVALQAEAELSAAGFPDRVVKEAVRAALLHDVGKASTRLGPLGRSIATVAEILGVSAHLPSRGERMSRLARYRDYGLTGRRWLEGAGSPTLVSAWAAEHHEPESRWTVPTEVGRVLAAADRAN